MRQNEWKENTKNRTGDFNTRAREGSPHFPSPAPKPAPQVQPQPAVPQSPVHRLKPNSSPRPPLETQLKPRPPLETQISSNFSNLTEMGRKNPRFTGKTQKRSKRIETYLPTLTCHRCPEKPTLWPSCERKLKDGCGLKRNLSCGKQLVVD